MKGRAFELCHGRHFAQIRHWAKKRVKARKWQNRVWVWCL